MNPIMFANFSDEFIKIVESLANEGDGEMGDLYNKLRTRKVILANHSLQSAKLIGGANAITIIDPTANDDRDLGLRNFDKSRLQKDEFFMPYSVQLQMATNLALSAAQLKTILFTKIGALGAAPANGILQNGEVNFRARTTNILRSYPISNFNTEGNSNVRESENFLTVRRIIRPSDDIFFETRFGAAAPADTALRVSIHGLITVPNA